MQRWISQTELATSTAVIIPAYFSAKPSDEMVQQLLLMTLGDSHHYLPLDQVWVVVDGDPRTAAILATMQQETLAQHGQSFRILSLLENRGKLGAIQAGMQAILAEQPQVNYLAIRDGDGDHANSALVELVRVAEALRQTYEHLNVMVIGSRTSRHHPMGWIRGELELLLDHLTIDATAFALAQEGRAINLRHCQQRQVPDLSSGFKVYGRELAQRLFVDTPSRYETMSASDYWHYGPETVTMVEAWLQDAIVAEVSRLTWDGQPATSFGEFSHLALYGELLAWVLARLDLPGDIAARLYDNISPAAMLRTTAPGRQLVNDLRDYVEQKLLERPGALPWPPAPAQLPFI